MSARLGDVFDSMAAERRARRGSTADRPRLRYANARLYAPLAAGSPPAHTLYVGVGHGLDALLALEEGLTRRVTGVDPFIGEQGNDEEDYRALRALVENAEAAARFRIERMTIQEYLTHDDAGPFDFIVCNDVLHHVFWTEELLRRSELAAAAVALFRELQAVASPTAMLAIGEPERHGPRQMLKRMGLLGGAVNYAAKQPSSEWRAAAERAGWRLVSRRYYVPWALRRLEPVLSGLLGRWTLCDKYFLHFVRATTQT